MRVVSALSSWFCILAHVQASITRGFRFAKEGRSVKKDVCPLTKKVLMVSVCMSSCWGEEIWKSLNIPWWGSFQALLGTGNSACLGKLVLHFHRGEKFSGHSCSWEEKSNSAHSFRPLLKLTESSSVGPVWRLKCVWGRGGGGR